MKFADRALLSICAAFGVAPARVRSRRNSDAAEQVRAFWLYALRSCMSVDEVAAATRFEVSYIKYQCRRVEVAAAGDTKRITKQQAEALDAFLDWATDIVVELRTADGPAQIATLAAIEARPRRAKARPRLAPVAPHKLHERVQ